MRQSLAQIFNETAAAAHDAFPQELRTLVVLLTPSSDTPVYVSPDIADQLTTNTADIKAAVKEVTSLMRARHFVGYADKDYKLAGTPINLLALDKNTISTLSGRYTKEMARILILDHEIGHHILKNGYTFFQDSWHLAENAADAYAVLRHIQRFGKKTDHTGLYSTHDASYIILFSDIEHYTTDAIQRALRLSEERDISGLSLRETAKLADEIALQCYLDRKTLEKIRSAFLPVKKSCDTHIGGVWEVTRKLRDKDKDAYALFCRKTLSVMKQHRHDIDILRAGRRFLSRPAIKKFMTDAAKTDPYWQEALDFINAPETKPPGKTGRSPSPLN